MYLVIENNGVKKYACTDTCNNPRLAIVNNSKTKYIPLMSYTGHELQVSGYKLGEYTTTASYYGETYTETYRTYTSYMVNTTTGNISSVDYGWNRGETTTSSTMSYMGFSGKDYESDYTHKVLSNDYGAIVESYSSTNTLRTYIGNTSGVGTIMTYGYATDSVLYNSSTNSDANGKYTFYSFNLHSKTYSTYEAVSYSWSTGMNTTASWTDTTSTSVVGKMTSYSVATFT